MKKGTVEVMDAMFTARGAVVVMIPAIGCYAISFLSFMLFLYIICIDKDIKK